MLNINSLYATLLLIRHTLVPPGKDGSRFHAPAKCALPNVAPEAFATQLTTLDSCLRQDGTLELLFEAALAPAAPFLLYHLKRNGYSDCKVVVTPDGIRLTARR